MPGKQKTGLAWILPEASRLRRQHPKRFSSWQEYVAEATAIYHRKKGDSMPKKKTTGKTRHSRTKKRPVAKNRSSRSVGSVQFHLRHAKILLEKKIGEMEASKLRIKTKTAKKKVQKKITAAKAEYRRLQ
jgi:hypothetical protein